MLKHILRPLAAMLLCLAVCSSAAVSGDFTSRNPGHNRSTARTDIKKSAERIPAPTLHDFSRLPKFSGTALPGAPQRLRAQSQATLFGCVIGADSWGYSDRPVGIYSINPNTGACSQTVAATLLDDGNPAGTYANGNFYACLVKDFYGNINSLKLVTIEVATGQISTYDYPSPTYSEVSVNMTYDAVNNIIYSINYGASTDEYNLCVFDPETKSYTVRGPLAEHYWGFCVNGYNEMFAVNDYGEVKQLNPSTGAEMRTVAATNFMPAMLQSCCWSPTDNRIYWAACNYSSSKLIAIDPDNGAVEDLCNFPDGEEIIGLYCTDPVADPMAPGACTGLTVSYSAPGAFTADITCTAPAVTVNGSQLEEPMTLSLSVDNREVATKTCNPGEDVTFSSVSLTEGVHNIAVVPSNDYGKGVPATLRTYAGVDLPAPAELNGSSDGTAVTLTWDIPAVGANGGWYDSSKITFNILRDGETIASGLTGDSYTDRPGSEMKAYRYTLVTFCDGVVCGESTKTLTCGDAVALPYSNPFATEDSFALLQILDNNNDGKTWKFNENQEAAEYAYSSSNRADDYLVLPPMKFTAGNVYHISLNARAISSSFPEKFEILWGRQPVASALTTVVAEPVTVPSDVTPYAANFTATESCTGYFAIHCVSDADMSSLYIFDVEVEDVGNANAPVAPVGFTAVPQDEGTKVTLSLTVPSVTFAGTAITSVDAIEITRNGQPINASIPANPAAGSVITVVDEAEQGFNSYEARAVLNGLRSVAAKARVFAGTYTIPLTLEPNAEEFTLFTVEPNAVSPDDTWYYDPSEKALKIVTYGSRDNDNFIFTPVIELGTANLISLSFDAQAVGYDTESVEVTFGRTADRSAQTSVQTVQVSGDGYQTQSVTFEPTEPGRYVIGFRCCSPARSTALLVKNIRVENGALKLCPAEATGLSVKAGDEGALTAAVTFTAPANDLNGDPLTAAITAKLLRKDGSVADTKENVTPGSAVTLSDASASLGMNDYTIVCSNAHGDGRPATVSGWVGVDVPGAVMDLIAAETADNLGAMLFWEFPAETLHNGWMEPENVKYNIYRLVDNRDLYKVAETTEPFCEVYPGEDYQDFYTYYVAAETEAGEGPAMGIGVTLGPPHGLPMIETASSLIITNNPWSVQSVNGDVNWGLADYIGSLDLAAPDGGMFVASAKLPERRPGSATMILPKLTLEGAVNPVLEFNIYRYAAASGTLKVDVRHSEGFENVLMLSTASDTEGWERVSVNLSKFVDKPWIAISFNATLTDGATYVIVDDIEAASRPDHDLGISSVRGRTSAAVGEEVSYTATVHNYGTQPHSFYLEHYVDGSRFAWLHSKTPLQPGASTTINYSFLPKAEHLSAPVQMEFRIVPDEWSDQDASNDVAAFPLTVVQPEMPVVTDLTGTLTPDNSVELSWSAPDLTPHPFTDDFDNYESFAYAEIGDYTLVDGDGLTPCGIVNVTFPNMGIPMAFQVWEPLAEGVDVDADIWAPHSGNKCLVAWTALSSVVEPYNDDWLISPELYASDGTSQVSFFCKRPVVDARYVEMFEFYYSTGSANPEDFTLLAQEKPMVGGWREYRYTLPEGATRFAIRYCARDAFALLFDDLTYMRQSATSSLAITGYTVRRSGAVVGTVSDGSCAFTDPHPWQGMDELEKVKYTVRVNYDRGTSVDSNALTLSLSGVENVTLDPDAPHIAVSPGQLHLSNLTPSTPVTLYTPDGRLFHSTVCGSTALTLPLPSGLYLLRLPALSTILRIP